MTERLGFDGTLTFVLLGALGLFALGGILLNISESPDITKQKDQDRVAMYGNLVQGISLIAAGGTFLVAAIRAEGHSTGVRVMLAIVGILLIFHNVFDVSFGVNLGGGA